SVSEPSCRLLGAGIGSPISALRVHHRSARSFPTRRSSDLLNVRAAPRKKQKGGWHVNNQPPEGPTQLDSHGLNLAFGRLVESGRSEEHTSELQSRFDLVCRLLLEKKAGPAG